MHEALEQLYRGQSLSRETLQQLFDVLLRGEMDPIVLSSLLTALKIKGESPSEIAGAASALIAAAKPFPRPDYDFCDIVGTGGDGLHTINVSTAVAFVAAGGGLRIAKHGNRAVSSRSGAADVLTELGVNLAATAEQQLRALDQANVAFFFAPAHHSAMRHVAPIRTDLGFRTIFNLLGPLTNPANAQRQVMGVFADRWVEPLARVLGALGAERAWVVHGSGLDEMTTTGETSVAEYRDGQVRLFTITPEAVGLPRSALADLTGGAPAQNAVALRELLDGAQGAYRNIVLLNAAAAFLVGEQVETLREGVELAGQIIDDGRAKAALDKLVEVTSA